MKTATPTALLAAAGLFLSSCERPAVATSVPAAAPAAPKPALVLDADREERDRLEREIEQLRVREQEMSDRLLEQERASLDAERAELQQARAALTAEKEALAKADEEEMANSAESPAPSAPRATVESSRPVLGTPAATPEPEDGDYQMFYEGLADHGRWFESEEFGWVWKPGVADEPGWRPYTRGQWVDTEQGWSWMSDEPFGWATYHYGRWALIAGQGWIWVPGDTWAPAWVVWRRNDDHVGWAPLPPETVYAEEVTYGPGAEADWGLTADWYTFLPVRHFDQPVAPYCRPVTENLQFFSLTVSLSSMVIHRDRVECRGPEPRWINSCLSRPMPRHSIHHRRDWRDRGDHRSRIENNRLSCYSPRVRSDWNEGLRPSRRHGRLENARVVKRDNGSRREIESRYQREREQRRQKAEVSLQREPVRQAVNRRAEMAMRRSSQDNDDSRRRETAERQRTTEQRERAEQTRRASQQQEENRRTAQNNDDSRRREAAERQRNTEQRERAEQARRASQQQEEKRRSAQNNDDSRRREAAERQRNTEQRERAESGRQQQEREAGARRETEQRRQNEERSRAQRSEEDRKEKKR